MTLTILEQEISEQPHVVNRLLTNEAGNVERLVGALQGTFDYVVIAARGTSDNAARYAKYVFGILNGLPVALAIPSAFTLYQRPPTLSRALVVGISQSGRSPDIVAVVEESRKQGRPTIAITNTPDSPLATAAEHAILLHAGEEKAVAATKTYTASLGALALLSAVLAGDNTRMAQLRELPDAMRRTVSGVAERLSHMGDYCNMDRCAIIGRGYNYATACEIALKVKELTRSGAEPYSSANFRHGPITVVSKGFAVMVIACTGPAHNDVCSIVADLKELDAKLLLISDDPSLLEDVHLAMPLATAVPEWLTPLVAVLPGQLFSVALAQAKGLNPDKPRGLSKVTETW